MADVLVMRRKVLRCCSVSNDAGGSLGKTQNSPLQCSAVFSFVHSSVLSPKPPVARRAGKLGRQKSGPKTYGGENDSGRLQVHLTAPEAVKQTRYVNGPNCKRGGEM